jgi:xylan 1,4-beta-xylosidase
MTTRRDLMKSALLAAGTTALSPPASSAAAGKPSHASRRGPENRRVADLGDGTYLNPVLSGDYADPTVLRDGDEYYMTNTCHDASPGIVLWRSPDLVNWTPIGPILFKPIGTVWAMDLIKHNGRYFLYIPAFPAGSQSIMVMHADRIEGPWSDPIDLHIPRIDPGHVVGEDGKRYLFVNGGGRVRLTDDGLATDGPLVEGAYELWKYPEDWVVEMYAPEGPKFTRRNGYFYLTAAVGGTAGPPTSHMIVVSRSKSIFGPWEQCPHNPIVRTKNASEPWWSRGHGTFVEGRDGDWWLVYHGYENGYRTLGRQVLLDPVKWDENGWPRALGGDLSKPLRKPRGNAAGLPAPMLLSDDFSSNKFGTLWRFHKPASNELQRVRVDARALSVQGKGAGPADCSPMTLNAGDRAYEFRVVVGPRTSAQGGVLLFYNEKVNFGMGFDGSALSTYAYGERHDWLRLEIVAEALHLKITNDHQIVTMHYSRDGERWSKHPWQFEVSGAQQNILGGFLSLRPALFCFGNGTTQFRDFRYRALA